MTVARRSDSGQQQTRDTPQMPRRRARSGLALTLSDTQLARARETTSSEPGDHRRPAGLPERSGSAGAVGQRPTGRPAGPALGKHANYPSRAARRGQYADRGHDARRQERRKRRARRSGRWRALRALWEVSTLDRCRKCRRTSVRDGGHVGVRHSAELGAGFSGLATCGSVWACPLCSARIAAKRAAEVAQAIKWCEKQGGQAIHVVLTIRHHRGRRLKACWGAIGKGWDRAASGGAWKKDKAAFGVIGWCRVVETTITEEHGWHVHVHALVLVDRPVSAETAEALGDRMWRRWDAGVRSKGFSSLRRSQSGEDVGVTARPVERGTGGAGDMGDYFAKAVYEVTHGAQTKTGVGRTPFQVLGDIVRSGLLSTGELTDDVERDLALWAEWEQASAGHQQLTWSNGTKAAAGVMEKKDEQLAAEDEGEEDLVLLPAETWQALRWTADDILDLVEDEGLHGFRSWLDRRGLAWLDPPGG